VLRNPQNLRSTKNFEQAMQRCSGDIVLLCDQDDRWHPNKLRTIADVFQASPDTVIAFSDAALIDGAGDAIPRRLWENVEFTPRNQELGRQGRLFEVLLKRYVVTGATMAIRKSALERLLPIPASWVHDAWLALVAAALEMPIVLVPAPLIDYRLHAGQQIGAPNRTYWQQYQFARSLGVDYIRRQANQYAAAAEHVAAALGELHTNVKRLRAKVAHLERRIALRQRPLLRWPASVREFAAGEYERYSLGWKTWLIDMVG
jgi:glycosyltransferase involved in cell wall biosynthesis